MEVQLLARANLNMPNNFASINITRAKTKHLYHICIHQYQIDLVLDKHWQQRMQIYIYSASQTIYK